MDPEFQWNTCIEKLYKGDHDGWPTHEWIRSGNSGMLDFYTPTPTFGLPIWTGGDEQELLVNADFGDGDTIQFVRFIEQAKQRVQRLVLRCDSDLHTLFQPLGVHLIDKIESVPVTATAISHLMALPRILGVKSAKDIPCGPYLAPVNVPLTHEQLFDIIGGLQFTKIGICWAGNPNHPRDKQRSIPVEELNHLFVEDGMAFFSFVRHVVPPPGFFDLRGLMKDWNQTAHLINMMDIIVSVDTAVAHLAGALGKQTALILPQNIDWRWAELGPHWYENHTLYRGGGGKDEWKSLLNWFSEDLLASFSQ